MAGLPSGTPRATRPDNGPSTRQCNRIASGGGQSFNPIFTCTGFSGTQPFFELLAMTFLN
jgi:hypothetical protein